jgi:hypothetical protein
VKELRLRSINTHVAANALAPHFIADFNTRFAKPPHRDLDAHRPIRAMKTWICCLPGGCSALPAQGHANQPQADPPLYRDVFEHPDGRPTAR